MTIGIVIRKSFLARNNPFDLDVSFGKLENIDIESVDAYLTIFLSCSGIIVANIYLATSTGPEI